LELVKDWGRDLNAEIDAFSSCTHDGRASSAVECEATSSPIHSRELERKKRKGFFLLACQKRREIGKSWFFSWKKAKGVYTWRNQVVVAVGEFGHHQQALTPWSLL
jgi:hypothetical protein